MTNEDDALALEVAMAMPLANVPTSELYEFARRYRAALLRKMEPIGHVCFDPRAMKHLNTSGKGLCEKCVPLYSLEDWK